MSVPLLLALVSAASAACPTPLSDGDLRARLTAAEAAFEAHDAAFLDRVAYAEEGLLCLAEPVNVSTAAEWHRVAGLRDFAHQDHAKAQRHFAAARALDNSRLSEWYAPPGNVLWEDFDAIPLDRIVRKEMPAPSKGRILVDGHATLARPDLPVIFQLEDTEGRIEVTTDLDVTDAPPYYPENMAVAEGPIERTGTPARFTPNDPHRRRRIAGVAIGGAGALAAATGGVLLWKGAAAAFEYGPGPLSDVYYIAGAASLAVGGLAVAGGTLSVIIVDGGGAISVSKSF